MTHTSVAPPLPPAAPALPGTSGSAGGGPSLLRPSGQNRPMPSLLVRKRQETDRCGVSAMSGVGAAAVTSQGSESKQLAHLIPGGALKLKGGGGMVGFAQSSLGSAAASAAVELADAASPSPSGDAPQERCCGSAGCWRLGPSQGSRAEGAGAAEAGPELARPAACSCSDVEATLPVAVAAQGGCACPPGVGRADPGRLWCSSGCTASGVCRRCASATLRAAFRSAGASADSVDVIGLFGTGRGAGAPSRIAARFSATSCGGIDKGRTSSERNSQWWST